MNARPWFNWRDALDAARDEVSGKVLAGAAAQLMHLHQRRRRLPAEEIDDTEWAILLEVFVGDTLGYTMTVTQLLPVAGVSQTTLVRYIDALEHKGLVVRERSTDDKRKVLVRIGEGGRAAVAQVFDPPEPMLGRFAA